MNVDDNEIFQFMTDVKQGIGQLLEGQKNGNEHMKAISNKADKIREDLEKHKESPAAHGLDAAEKKQNGILNVIAIIVSVVTALVGLIKWNG